MNQMAKRVVALAIMLAATLLPTMAYVAASNVTYRELKSDAQIVMTINGSPVHADEYASYMCYYMQSYMDFYMYYGIEDLWADPEGVAMIAPQLPIAAKEQAIYMRVILEHFQQEGLKLSREQQEQINAQYEMGIHNAGSEAAYLRYLTMYGLDKQLYQNLLFAGACSIALDEHYFGENGTMAASPDELLAYFQDLGYLAAKHILIQTIDPMTGEQIRTEEQALADARDILNRIEAGEDFDALMEAHSEDTGLAYNPDGYLFGIGEMVQEFYDGTQALEEGAISEPVQSPFGYHIIKRLPLTDDMLNWLSVYGSDYRTIANQGLGKTIDSLISQWIREADVQTTELLDQITYQNAASYARVAPNSTDELDEGAAR